MRSLRTLSAALTCAALAAACGGETAENDQTDAAPEMAVAAATTSCFLAGATLEEAQARPSPLMEVAFSVGGQDGSLCYGAPSANGRVVMGELVPFGEAWRLGANEATAIHLSGPAVLGGVAVDAGTYSLYAVPGQAEWTFYLNSNADRWGIPIGDDVRATETGSFTAAVEATEAPVEQLVFRFEPAADGAGGTLVMEWENTRVRIPVAPAA